MRLDGNVFQLATLHRQLNDQSSMLTNYPKKGRDEADETFDEGQVKL